MLDIYRILRYDWPLHFVLLFTNWLPDNVVFMRFRGWLSHFFFKSCGNNIRLGRGIVFYNPSRIEIGNNNYIAFGNWFAAGGRIIIGDNNLIGPYSIFVSGNHVFDGSTFDNTLHDRQDIIIGSNNWIGGHCQIIKGALIKNKTLIASGAILNKELPDNCTFVSKHSNTIVQE